MTPDPTAQARALAQLLGGLVANRGQADKDCPFDAEGVRLIIVESFADLFLPDITTALLQAKREGLEEGSKITFDHTAPDTGLNRELDMIQRARRAGHEPTISR